MTVRAKFRLNSYTTQMGGSYPYKKPDGSIDYNTPVMVEQRTFNFTPVREGSVENSKFFAATPSGSLQLGAVNQDVWSQFELNKDYYLDFTPA